MKTFVLAFVHVACALVLISAACSDMGKRELPGKWHTKNGLTRLEITDKNFITSEDGIPSAEDYFIEGDTIFTSFEGSQPYSKFVIEHLEDKKLTLLYPDSVSVEFIR
jgi:hypothetical protein